MQPGAVRLPGQRAAGLTALVSGIDGYYREYFMLHPGASFALVNEAMRLARPFVVLLILMGSGVACSSASGAAARLRAAGRGLRPDAGDRRPRPSDDVGRPLAERARRDRAALLDPGRRARHRLAPTRTSPGITYYTRLPTRMVDGAGADLLFGYRRGDSPERFWSREELLEHWRSDQRIFLVSDKSFEMPDAVVLAEGRANVLCTNHPLPALDIGTRER